METTGTQKNIAHTRLGTLTIFAGYASGCGKTYRMLQTAQRAIQCGTDVVLACAEPELWPETAAFRQKFECLPVMQCGSGGPISCEFDLDTALQRKPELLVLDNLAHCNAGDARHKNRYQDIQELLNAGIHVYTTIDIVSLESMQDATNEILGEIQLARVPDDVFDDAEKVEFVDLEPQDLQWRLEQKTRGTACPELTQNQIGALRELGMRRCADRVSFRLRQKERSPYHTQEHILVCLSGAPSNAKIIRTAAKMAGAFRGSFTALFVETKAFQYMSPQDKESLRRNLHLAEHLGATVETVYGDDIPVLIAEFARASGVSKIVMGRSEVSQKVLLHKPTLTERLIELAPEVDIHIIPDNGMEHSLAVARKKLIRLTPVPLRDFLKSFLLLLAATLVGLGFYELGFSEANIITVYLLSVMIISVVTQSSFCSFLGSAASVLIFNFFFTEPRYSLHAYDSEYPVTFLVMFVAALITGSLAAKLKSHAQHSAQVAWRAKLLFETNQNLQKAISKEQILTVTAEQIVKLFRRNVVVYTVQGGALTGPQLFVDKVVSTEQQCPPYESEQERNVAEWVWKNNRRAGYGTGTFENACCVYFSVRMGERVYAVLGIDAQKKAMDAFDNSILLSVLGECGLALDSKRNAEEKEAAAVLAKNEQLRANLLRSISHDLRTPLTSISGNAGNLIANGALFDEETKKQIYTDIYDDSIWLINLVENLLSVSRLNGGEMHLRLSTELMEDVVAEALRHVNRKSSEYKITVSSEQEYLLAQIDVKLVIQVLINIIDNAIKYTPVGSEIRIHLKKQGQFIVVSIADNGPGVPDSAKPHVFEMFYSAANKIADSRRSMGLGLALCKSIIDAHGGEITVSDAVPHGAVFTFTLPAGEVKLHD